jgi:hypothetical protein
MDTQGSGDGLDFLIAHAQPKRNHPGDSSGVEK